MIWIFINLLIVSLVVIYSLYLVRASRVKVELSHATSLQRAEFELKTKQKILEDIAMSISGLVSTEDIDQYSKEIIALEEQSNSLKGKYAISEAEIEALDIRLRELEELRRELEVSKMDAIKEIEMLKAQERDISNQNAAINAQLKSSQEQLDILLDMLQSNSVAVEQLNKTKNEITNIEKKISYYEEEVARINQQYVGLKRAYDALDIEYAQLYEKRQSEIDS